MKKDKIEIIKGASKVRQTLFQIQEFIGSGLYEIPEDDDEGCLDGINDELYFACEKAVNIITAAKELLESIDENHWSLWENDLQDKHDCVLLYKDDYQIDEKDDGTWETEHKNGIIDSYNQLKKALKGEE